MLKNKLVLYILGGLVVVGGAVAVMGNKSAGPAGNTAENTSPESPKTLKNLIAGNVSQKCTFDQKIENSESQGTVYVASGKMRGDFTSVASGKTMTSHMIVSGDTSYMWTDEMKQGFKMTLADVEGDTQAESHGSIDMNQELNYNCDPWSGDASLFVLPSGITFSDMNAMMQGGTGAGAGAGAGMDMSAICASCDGAGDSKAQCRAALGCK